ncbi:MULTISPECIES: transketolase [unclassified Campylobacter]|uniref:transketolase n=1 Tax=unclassified Campylobacter TaxID=2593542 RepID=UPI001237C5CA|nr:MULTISPECIES: transketolase [unclassified Campylobacter]KAA6224587.1 transketolase [Campylobacter sp. LR185c]KAA6224829.1 transketolase [Campylobacter sp. LR286c]KAA6227977.1 transketolase [Campylobacter sp. LR196d]KAA6233456.1 transketolase [Campylobacter sp. LR291e]KAA6234393.1 transketolase [Campylobacter sp. LR264d]
MLSKELRKDILKISNKAKSSHIGSNLSCIDILIALYFKVMYINKEDFANRDIFILSKAHAALSLYVTLYHKGFLSKESLDSFYQNNGTLPAHLDKFSNEFIESSAGSLGHGLPIALGIALSLKLNFEKGAKFRKVFCLMGDGESQEGSVWEAIMLAPVLRLNNLRLLIDYNNLQAYARTNDILPLNSLSAKLLAFGWEVFECDGHDIEKISSLINDYKGSKPLCLICKTIKGKGVSFMQDKLHWHYYALSDEELQLALEELK